MAEANKTSPSTLESFQFDFHTQQQLIIEDFIIIWLDTNLNILNNNSTIIHLQHLVHLILSFTDSDRCLDFISDIKNEKIFLIISGSLGENIVPIINNLYQIDSIYVYCDNRGKHEKWANKEKKIKGVFTKIEPIYDALRRDKRQCEDDLIPFNILSSTYNENENFNFSDRLFIYTQLIKDILLEMDYQPNVKIDFLKFCFSKYQNNNYQLNLIQEFANNYYQSSSIRWYTRECFIHSMLNKAFRICDMKILTQMGFFIRDIHQEIQQLHSKLNKQNHLIVYRGQGILEDEFHKILENQNGFLSFNNFLITTTDKDISLTYARCARDHHQLIGILFEMEIDRSKSLFTPLDKISYYSESEKEILFSTHTIFRIHTIHQIENGLWQIQLRLTTDEDKRLKHIKGLIRKKTEGKNGLERLDILMNELQSTEMEVGPPVEEDVRHVIADQSMTDKEIEPGDPPMVNGIRDEQPLDTPHQL